MVYYITHTDLFGDLYKHLHKYNKDWMNEEV